jgi:hypothetical protein
MGGRSCDKSHELRLDDEIETEVEKCGFYLGEIGSWKFKFKPLALYCVVVRMHMYLGLKLIFCALL